MHRTALPLLLLLACKPRHTCEDPQAPVTVQLLAAADPLLNPDEDGSSWPTNLRVYELRRGAELDRLDFEALFNDAEKALGQQLIKVSEFTIFPDRRKRWQLELAPETEQVVTVGLFRQPIGDAWYQVYDVPRDHNAQRCAAEEQGRELPDPCVYLAFEHSEINGGRFPPAGFDVQLFETACAPVVALPRKASKKRRGLRKPKLPQVPNIPRIPELPRTPTLPQTPQTPTAPAAPKAPAAPAAPKAPNLPRR